MIAEVMAYAAIVSFHLMAVASVTLSVRAIAFPEGLRPERRAALRRIGTLGERRPRLRPA